LSSPNTGIVAIKKDAFEHPEKIELAILHEVGHSTVEERTVAGFKHLPPEDWMKLSDWQLSSPASLGADLHIGAKEVSDVITKLNERASHYQGIPCRYKLETEWLFMIGMQILKLRPSAFSTMTSSTTENLSVITHAHIPLTT
jgi:hypothetical protein